MVLILTRIIPIDPIEEYGTKITSDPIILRMFLMKKMQPNGVMRKNTVITIIFKGTKQGGSMHETKGKDKESSCGLNDVKEQLSNLTKMIGEFKKENEVVKSEISDMKQRLNNQGAKKLTTVKPIMNNNNKRVKESSSSESENNNIIFNLETRVEKQDQLLTNMYDMINRIAESISDNENDNKKQNNKAVSNIGGIGGSSNVNANNNH
ncbi:unnamed protein product [Rhizophagus irregularis]|nr:unnamed protein product [Rhizophagus irregularis]